jgi:hypothetical protein
MLGKILEIVWNVLRKSERDIYKLKFEKDASRIPVLQEVWVIFFSLKVLIFINMLITNNPRQGPLHGK